MDLSTLDAAADADLVPTQIALWHCGYHVDGTADVTVLDYSSHYIRQVTREVVHAVTPWLTITPVLPAIIVAYALD